MRRSVGGGGACSAPATPAVNFGSHANPISMPIDIPAGSPTLVVRKDAFERVGLTRAALDARLNLTADEFRVEGSLVAIGPLVGDTALTSLIEELEALGLEYFEDFFELSGNWPEWLGLFALGR